MMLRLTLMLLKKTAKKTLLHNILGLSPISTALIDLRTSECGVHLLVSFYELQYRIRYSIGRIIFL